MSKKKIVIIGGVAGGATFAARLRRISEIDEIIMIDKGEYISFANCGIPYHISGVIANRDSLLLNTVESFNKRYGVDARNFSEAIKISPDEHKITIKNHKTGETYEESYDTLVISTGARPIVPPIAGLSDAGNVFTLRNIPDMDNIIEFIKKENVKKAAVIGGGFIGLEVAENLRELGIAVDLVEKSPQVMPPLDFEMAQILHGEITKNGVNLMLDDGVSAFHNAGKTLELSSGEKLSVDMSILAIGVAPESEIAKDAGITTGARGGVVVDEQFRTSAPDIYAIGDVIEVRDFVSGLPTMIPLAWPANRQGRILADIIKGSSITYKGTLGTSVVKVFGLTAASTGNSEKMLIANNIPYRALHINAKSHAGYYPGATELSLKLLYAPDGSKVLGAQAIGENGVDKRIDVIATAIKLGASVYDLSDLELAYAPPYGSSKDPVNIAGYVAENRVAEEGGEIQWNEIEALRSKKEYILDVRTKEENRDDSIEGTVLIPVDELRDRLGELPKDKPIHVYCRVGQRGYLAERILKNHDFAAKNLDGGFITYKHASWKKD